SIIIKEANSIEIPVTISGGGTGLSGGRAPLGGWIIATDNMVTLEEDEGNSIRWQDVEVKKTYQVHLEEINHNKALLTVPVSMTIKSIQNFVKDSGWFYPPDPTERSAFIGGNVTTNASGARSFKYGSTRDWVHSLRVVTPTGEILILSRDDTSVIDKNYIHLKYNNTIKKISRPKYKVSNVRKNVAGPIIHDTSHPIDLFIGTDGLFGVITQVTLNLIRQPEQISNIMVYCDSVEQSFNLIELCREQRDLNLWPIPLSVEYLDENAVKIIRSRKQIQDSVKSIVILEQDTSNEDDFDKAIDFWINVFEKLGIQETSVALSAKEIENHKEIRHAVPETVNSIVRKHSQSKLGTDYSVPPRNFKDIFHRVFEIGEEFEKYQNARVPLGDSFGYAFWAHAGDSHVHLNLLPRNDEEYIFAKNKLFDLMKQVVLWEGSIAAEHGLGKKRFDGKPALFYMYGQEGLDEIKNMKLEFDPLNLLNRGNLID
ncbi:MAG: FAD-binding oxidoreductase, partial [Candidatus Heimdallarchaeota archaeon]|nr:FAD-binding oxidoreductase [Candidatus Heimdallarchaeota archaeon]